MPRFSHRQQSQYPVDETGYTGGRRHRQAMVISATTGAGCISQRARADIVQVYLYGIIVIIPALFCAGICYRGFGIREMKLNAMIKPQEETCRGAAVVCGQHCHSADPRDINDCVFADSVAVWRGLFCGKILPVPRRGN